jgi:hypothetical protein
MDSGQLLQRSWPCEKGEDGVHPRDLGTCGISVTQACRRENGGGSTGCYIGACGSRLKPCSAILDTGLGRKTVRHSLVIQILLCADFGLAELAFATEKTYKWCSRPSLLC